MTEIPFHATRMGRTYYEHTVPEIVRQLQRLNENFERLTNDKEKPDDEDVHTTDARADDR